MFHFIALCRFPPAASEPFGFVVTPNRSSPLDGIDNSFYPSNQAAG
jgi:hypothetical protein